MELLILIFQEVIFGEQKMKKICSENFSKWNFLAPNSKKFLYFRRKFAKPEKQKY